MIDITYTAIRRLVNALDQVVTIETDLVTWDRSTETDKSTDTSIGGVRQSTLHYFTDTFFVDSMNVEPADRPEFDEFIYSTINEEAFIMEDTDDGTELNVTRIGDYNRVRVTNGTLDYFAYSFEVRVIV